MDVCIRKAELLPIAPPVKTLLACVPEARNWYPGFLGWFGRAMDEVSRGRRMLWTAETDGEPVGLLIAKQGPYQVKICCLGVHPLCRGCGIGGMLMEKAVFELGEQDIVLTVSDRMMPGMRKLLIKFSFLPVAILAGRYRAGHDEYVCMRGGERPAELGDYASDQPMEACL